LKGGVINPMTYLETLESSNIFNIQELLNHKKIILREDSDWGILSEILSDEESRKLYEDMRTIDICYVRDNHVILKRGLMGILDISINATETARIISYLCVSLSIGTLKIDVNLEYLHAEFC
jgi:hypothetical protein